MDDQEALTDSISSQADTILAKTRANTAQIKKLDEMIRFGKNILETQPIMDQMNAIHWKGRRERKMSFEERAWFNGFQQPERRN